MSVLVTGGCGFIGSHTCVELLERGLEVIVADNLSNSDKRVLAQVEVLTGEAVPFFETDLRDKDKLRDLFARHTVRAVVHFAGLKAVAESLDEPVKYYQNNLVSTLNLLEVMHAAGCEELVFSSSATVYGSSPSPLSEKISQTGVGITNPYGQTKHMLEVILADFARAHPKFKITSLRYFNPVGAHPSGLIGENPTGYPNNLMPYLLRVAGRVPGYDELAVFGGDYDTVDGSGVRDFVHVADLASCHATVVLDPKPGFRVFNVGSGVGTSVLQLIECFERVNNLTIPYRITPRRRGDLAQIFCKPDKIWREFRWKTTKTLEDICRDAWRYFLLRPK